MAKVALLIGVSEYEPGLNPLPAAAKDIQAMQRVLQNPGMGGFDEVKILANPDPQTMQYEIETLFSSRTRDDLVLLFFSGHGIKDDSGKLYFATRITRKNHKGNLIRSTSVPASFIHDIMNNSRARRQAIILDCCFSGAFDPSLQAKDDGSVDLKNQLGAEGRVVLTSSSSTEYSFEQQGSDLSIYSRYLVEGIETGAGDKDEDGKISIRELHEYAASKVQETAPNMTPKLITLKDMGFEMFLAKAEIADPRLRYRKQVEKYVIHGVISSTGRTILDTLQKQLDLSSEIANEIEDEVLRPYRERLNNIQKYKQAFVIEIENEYPLSELAKAELKDLCQILGLREEDVSPIETEEGAKKLAKVEARQGNLNRKILSQQQWNQYGLVRNEEQADVRSENQATQLLSKFTSFSSNKIALLLGRVLLTVVVVSSLPFLLSRLSQPSKQPSDLTQPSPSPVLPPSTNSPSSMDYSKLTQYLRENAWKDADAETERLLYEPFRSSSPYGTLTDADIPKIPCETLRTIDQLWIDTSQGRFGLSVKGQIWKEVGGQPGVYDSAVYEKFANRVGWVRTSTSSFQTFSANAPEGHLPQAGFALGSTIAALSTRLETCNIQ